MHQYCCLFLYRFSKSFMFLSGRIWYTVCLTISGIPSRRLVISQIKAITLGTFNFGISIEDKRVLELLIESS